MPLASDGRRAPRAPCGRASGTFAGDIITATAAAADGGEKTGAICSPGAYLNALAQSRGTGPEPERGGGTRWWGTGRGRFRRHGAGFSITQYGARGAGSEAGSPVAAGLGKAGLIPWDLLPVFVLTCVRGGGRDATEEEEEVVEEEEEKKIEEEKMEEQEEEEKEEEEQEEEEKEEEEEGLEEEE
ncbi:unnamed protein product [Gadus morhua 'NCC']